MATKKSPPKETPVAKAEVKKVVEKAKVVVSKPAEPAKKVEVAKEVKAPQAKVVKEVPKAKQVIKAAAPVKKKAKLPSTKDMIAQMQDNISKVMS